MASEELGGAEGLLEEMGGALVEGDLDLLHVGVGRDDDDGRADAEGAELGHQSRGRRGRLGRARRRSPPRRWARSPRRARAPSRAPSATDAAVAGALERAARELARVVSRPRRGGSFPSRARLRAGSSRRNVLRVGIVEDEIPAHRARQGSRDGEPEAEPLRLGGAERLEEGGADARVERAARRPTTRTTACPPSTPRRMVIDPPAPASQATGGCCRPGSRGWSARRRDRRWRRPGRSHSSAHHQAVFRGERADVVGQGSDEAIEGDALELRLAEARAWSGGREVRRGPARPGRARGRRDRRAAASSSWQAASSSRSSPSAWRGLLSSWSTAADEHPHRLIALDLLQARAQRLGAAGRLLRAPRAGRAGASNARTRRAAPRPGPGRRDRSPRARWPGPRSASRCSILRLGDDVEEDVRRPQEHPGRDVRDRARSSRGRARSSEVTMPHRRV